jgi:hypothetical protein
MATNKMFMIAGASLLSCALAVAPAWADPDKKPGGHGDRGYAGHGEGYGRGGHGMGAVISSAIC